MLGRKDVSYALGDKLSPPLFRGTLDSQRDPTCRSLRVLFHVASHSKAHSTVGRAVRQL